jgi:hypothetical protein
VRGGAFSVPPAGAGKTKGRKRILDVVLKLIHLIRMKKSLLLDAEEVLLLEK